MTQFRLSRAAQSDIVQILSWSHAQFGEQARRRYEALIIEALRDAATVRDGAGSTTRPEFGPGVFSWHLRQSRGRTVGTGVRRPRHVLIYRVDEDQIVVARVLHDAMELRRHLNSETVWE